ncbi:phage/plasmid-like protein (TIGR03299 family) [Streptomyces aurantiacus]|uniref:DUF932 domain-containing protein n=1 Tax=Streptomyces aurantiacus TaxID=47760 RepID=UPI0027905BAC|nr:DUF932 domain-containing protein [Streptomyces aurantiacus]MDQ0772915.1 phage/plasmid-like protein (TIGR03299 family) [Streptomyces aurantiacus]
MTTDLNAAFTQEKTEQIEAVHEEARAFQERIDRGEITSVGGDRYRVLTGWDEGETFTVRRNTEGQIEQILAQHGLDTTTGGAALYTATPAWHGLGAVIPGGITDIDEVLKLARIDWEVSKRPVLYEWDDGIRDATDHYVTLRTDTGDVLGTVGDRYKVFQNRRVFEFLQDLVQRDDAVWESAGALRGGRKTFVTMQIPHSIVIDRGGLDDEIALYLAAINSHDGTSSAESVVTPWRIECGNTERFATRDAVHRWGIRHTKGGLSALEEARRTLGLTLDYAKAFEREENQLVRTDLLIDDFHKLVDGVWTLDEDATDRQKNFAQQRHDELEGMFHDEARKLGRTAYAAERTVTDYLDHRMGVVPRNLSEDLARAQRSLEGTNDDLKSKAHRKLLLVAR